MTFERTMLDISPATPADVPTIFNLIGQLAVYEKLEHMVTGTEAMLHENLFGARPSCECVVARVDGMPIGFALYFTTFSTFLCKPGLYLEDLFVIPAARGAGHGKALLKHLANLALQRGCGRFEWRVLDWNKPSIEFYKSLGASILPEWYLVRMIEPEIEALLARKD
ncbi:MAG: GNAT family N-acetyltransferase [Betaproteobacteria bacterium]|nr:GNAT family N-acetyltransferase [Betaproteobacteria bacterium]